MYRREAAAVCVHRGRSLSHWERSSAALISELGDEIYDGICNGIRMNKQCIVSHTLLVREQQLRRQLEEECSQYRQQGPRSVRPGIRPIG